MNLRKQYRYIALNYGPAIGRFIEDDECEIVSKSVDVFYERLIKYWFKVTLKNHIGWHKAARKDECLKAIACEHGLGDFFNG